MKNNINRKMILITCLAVLLTFLSVTGAYYSIYQKQVKKDIKLEAEIFSSIELKEIVDIETLLKDNNIRVTWISRNGEVLFDNDVDIGTLENHLDRPEVKSAIERGYGEADRKSDTLNMRSFYYALLLNDGTILRVAKNASSIFNVFFTTIPVILIVVLIVIIICLSISSVLTKQIVDPINKIAESIDDFSDQNTYKELEPFVKRIKEQHENIIEASKLRQDFTANVSHELKTPITAISGYAELIENDMVGPEKQIEFAAEIRNNCQRLISLINDIIHLSEYDRYKMAGDLTSFDLLDLVKERTHLIIPVANSRNISVKCSGTSEMISADRSMIVELVDNLLQNAIRYNKINGSVNAVVTKKNGHVLLVIEDNGIGIPKEDQKRVFERFYRVDKSRSRETGGTGLGLSLVKHIVELHNAEIVLNSEVDKGTRIEVIF